MLENNEDKTKEDKALKKFYRKKGNEILKEWGNSKAMLESVKREIDFFNTEKALKYKNIKSEYELLEGSLIRKISLIDIILENFTEEEKEIIYRRYVKKESWQTVAIETNYSMRSVFNVRNKVIDKLAILIIAKLGNEVINGD